MLSESGKFILYLSIRLLIRLYSENLFFTNQNKFDMKLFTRFLAVLLTLLAFPIHHDH